MRFIGDANIYVIDDNPTSEEWFFVGSSSTVYRESTKVL